MKFAKNIIQLIIPGVVGSTVGLNLLLLAIASPEAKAVTVQLAQVLAPEEINLRTKQIIVRIDGASVGSGSIVDYSDNVYTVLTNWHVMKNQGEYFVQTIDGRKHQVMPATIRQLPGLDLAVFQFTSKQNYQTAELGDSSNLSEGQNVYFAGYPGELRREDNRYYRFFTANVVGILPKSTENGYSLIYNGEAFPGMSGGPVLSKEGLIIGIHGEANIHALSGGTSNYAIPINNYLQAIAKQPQPTAKPLPPLNPQKPLPTNPTVEASPAGPEVTVTDSQPTTQPEVEPTAESEETIELSSTPPEVVTGEQPQPSQPEVEPTSKPTVESEETIELSSPPPEVVIGEQPQPTTQPEVEPTSKPTAESIDSDNISSVPTFTSQPSSETVSEPEVVIEPESSEQTTAVAESETDSTVAPEVKQPDIATKPAPKPTESEEIEVPTTTRRISLISEKTGIDYTELRNLLRAEKWSEADIYTYRLIEQVVKSAKQQNKHIFIELKTIAEFACPDVRTVDFLWRKYSDAKFGFSPQQEIWKSVNQKGDFSTQTWRRFATEVGWKKGEVANGSGYLLYEQLDFEPTNAPAGHLPWWFALPDEEQKVIKYLFGRCNLNPTAEELEAETQKNPSDTAQNPDDNQNQETKGDRQ